MPAIRDFMTSNVLVTTPDQTVLAAAKLMKEQDRGSIIVVDGKKPVAIVTERDLLKRVVAEGLSPGDTTIKDIMSTPVVSIGPNESLKRASKLMQLKKIRRLPVVDGGKLVGIITMADLAALDPHELL